MDQAIRAAVSRRIDPSLSMIQIKAVAGMPRKNWRMAKRFSTTELVAIAIIVLSVAVLAFVGFSIWIEP